MNAGKLQKNMKGRKPLNEQSHNISTHISNILKEKELDKISVVKDYLTTAVK